MRRPLLVVVPVVALAAGLTAARLLADDSTNPPAAPAAPTDAAKAKEAKVRKLLKLQGAEEVATIGFNKTLDQFKAMPNLPAGFVEMFRAKASVQEMVDLSIPAYVKHLDDATLDAAIAFYETPAGKTLAGQLPAIQTEAADAGVVWGQKKAMEVMKALQEKNRK